MSDHKPSSPPPAYTEFAEPPSGSQPAASHTQPGPSYSQPRPPAAPESTPPSASGPAPLPPTFPTHAHYGPTPIAQQAALLPYYDPRSPHAIAESESRARWRFVGAFMWAVVILALVGVASGYEVGTGVWDRWWGSW
ncbi:hypothetical protein CERSUDRAFT_91054 [Gelatoporia subvermispora B]|uniref:Uncharacterized protein n=1 Tax=Ceriporiopsis subvermispora (strain B) TaxID=914234 RepID=M2RPG4_CERS8|nr:hypothetical protein CERSUDRAFT_91054 [Gelatoporia subvermispora B]